MNGNIRFLKEKSELLANLVSEENGVWSGHIEGKVEQALVVVSDMD